MYSLPIPNRNKKPSKQPYSNPIIIIHLKITENHVPSNKNKN